MTRPGGRGLGRAIARGGRGLGALYAASLVSIAGCQAFVDSTIKSGIGATCISDVDCQGSVCVDKLCTLACSTSDDCPDGTECKVGFCDIGLRAAFLYTGAPGVEEWSTDHEIGRVAAQTALPYLESTAVPDVLLAGDAANAIDTLANEGVRVLVVNTPALSQTVSSKAKQFPQIDFLTCGGGNTDPNVHGYFGRLYQAWYLAGYAAGKKTLTKRVGFVASAVTPNVVRDINAFLLGAQAVDMGIQVEVQWIGFFHDTGKPNLAGKTLERVLTERLMASKCDVIANHADNGIVVATLEGTGVASIATNLRDGCPVGSKNCLGSVYFNWAPLYTRVLDEFHKNTFDGQGLYEPIQIDPAQSLVNFQVNTSGVFTQMVQMELGNLTAMLASGPPTLPFAAPLCAATTQRDVDMDMMPDCLMPMQSLTDADLDTMCWFVKGVVEKVDPTNPMSMDTAANVPDAGDCKMN